MSRRPDSVLPVSHPASGRSRLKEVLWAGLQTATPVPPRVLLCAPEPTGVHQGEYRKVSEGPGAVRVDRYVDGVITHQLQLDLLRSGAIIDFATIKPYGYKVKWYGGPDAVRAHLEADSSERSIFKSLAYELLNKRAGPEGARDVLTEFTESLSDAGYGVSHQVAAIKQ